MKIKLNSDDDLQWNKQWDFPTIKIVVRSVFEEDGKYLLQVYIDECLYELYGFHDLMQKTMNFNDVVIVPFKWSGYRIYFWYMSKDDAINILNNFHLSE